MSGNVLKDVYQPRKHLKYASDTDTAVASPASAHQKCFYSPDQMPWGIQCLLVLKPEHYIFQCTQQSDQERRECHGPSSWSIPPTCRGHSMVQNSRREPGQRPFQAFTEWPEGYCPETVQLKTWTLPRPRLSGQNTPRRDGAFAGKVTLLLSGWTASQLACPAESSSGSTVGGRTFPQLSFHSYRPGEEEFPLKTSDPSLSPHWLAKSSCQFFSVFAT